MRKLIVASLFAGLSLTGCGKIDNAGESSDVKAQVTYNQAMDAYKVISAINYLPFLFIEDGCYARSLYMSMELASQGIPSSAHYIYGDLRPTAEVNWGYHVAPMIQIGNSEPWILDPAMDKQPLPVTKWVAKNFPNGRFTEETKAGSAYFDYYRRTTQFNNNRMIQNFAEMPAFLTSDVASACTVMYNYIPEQGNFIEAAAMRSRLLKKTADLLNNLYGRGKLIVNGVPVDTNSACRKAAGF